jgi:uncharacterized cupin superfamily protein
MSALGIPARTASPADLAGPLTSWGPRVGADRGDPQTAGLVLLEGDGLPGVGVWECTPGSWEITDRSDTEVVHILAGRARITDAAGDEREVATGDVLILPRGWSGRWDVLETLRKLYVVVP